MGLFALSGALGGVLRSLAYLLAASSFSERERKQWQTEAVVGPVLGAASGLAAYLLVRAVLVGGEGAFRLSARSKLSADSSSAGFSVEA